MKYLFHIATVLLLLLTSCKDKPTDTGSGGTPPCLECPGDFLLTDFESAWSPDGRTIAYVHGDTTLDKTGIYLIDTNGTNKRILFSSASAYSPTWSPDGKWIAFYDKAQIFKIKITGDSLTQLTTEGRNFFPAWSLDGQWIAYDRSLADSSGPGGIWIMKPDGTQKRAIFGGAFPSWHPNNQSLLGVIGTSPTSIWTRFVQYYPFQTIRSETLSVIIGNVNNYPKYSPDGVKIAFTSQPDGGYPHIWAMNSDGTNLRQLTTTQGYTCDWSRTGEWIVYTDSRAISGRLWLIRSDGSGNHQLTF